MGGGEKMRCQCRVPILAKEYGVELFWCMFLVIFIFCLGFVFYCGKVAFGTASSRSPSRLETLPLPIILQVSHYLHFVVSF